MIRIENLIGGDFVSPSEFFDDISPLDGTVNAKMDMFALDVVIPAGNALELVISQTNDDYIPSPVSSGYVTIGTNQNNILTLPIIDRSPEDLFMPPIWYDEEI